MIARNKFMQPHCTDNAILARLNGRREEVLTRPDDGLSHPRDYSTSNQVQYGKNDRKRPIASFCNYGLHIDKRENLKTSALQDTLQYLKLLGGSLILGGLVLGGLSLLFLGGIPIIISSMVIGGIALIAGSWSTPLLNSRDNKSSEVDKFCFSAPPSQEIRCTATKHNHLDVKKSNETRSKALLDPKKQVTVLNCNRISSSYLLNSNYYGFFRALVSSCSAPASHIQRMFKF